MMCSDPSRLLQCLCYHVCVCARARVLLEKIPEEFLIFFAAKYMMTTAVLFFKDLRVCVWGGGLVGGQQEAISLDLVFDSLNTTVCVCVW